MDDVMTTYNTKWLNDKDGTKFFPVTHFNSVYNADGDNLTTVLSDLDNYATEDYVDTAVSNLVNSAPATLDTLKELSDALGGDANFATTVSTQIGQKQDAITSSNKLSADLIEDGTTNKAYTATEQSKLANIAAGAEVNQNAFSNVKVGSTTIAADSKTDTLELVAGDNVTLTPDATNDKVTIAATDTQRTRYYLTKNNETYVLRNANSAIITLRSLLNEFLEDKDVEILYNGNNKWYHAVSGNVTMSASVTLVSESDGIIYQIALNEDSNQQTITGVETQYPIPSAYDNDPEMDGTASAGSSTSYAKGDHVHPTDTSRAPLASPALTGTPTAPTAATGTNTTQIATTAFVKSAVDGKQDVISDLATIRSGASAGATAYQKPSGGIPSTDLASGVIPIISTDIATDATSDTKTASPKAVKTYVDDAQNVVIIPVNNSVVSTYFILGCAAAIATDSDFVYDATNAPEVYTDINTLLNTIYSYKDSGKQVFVKALANAGSSAQYSELRVFVFRNNTILLGAGPLTLAYSYDPTTELWSASSEDSFFTNQVELSSGSTVEKLFTGNSATIELKTINSTSLLGSGDISVPTTLSDLTDDSTHRLVTDTEKSTWNSKTSNTGTVTSVAMTVPTGLSVSGSPITTSGTLAVSLASGYEIPTTTQTSAWSAKQPSMSITTSTATSLTAALDTCYRFTSTVGTLAITLPAASAITDGKVHNIVFYITTGSSPAVTFTAASSGTVNYFDGFSIDASTEYEINAQWNGAKWVLSRTAIVSSI